MSCDTTPAAPDLHSNALDEHLRTAQGPPRKTPLFFFGGSAARPAVASTEDPRSGFFWPAVGQVGIAINGLQRWLFTALGYAVTFGRFSINYTANLTANREITWPDESGEVMLRGATATEHSSLTIQVTSSVTPLVAANTERKSGWVTNNGSEEIWIGPEDTVTVGNVVSATGGSVINPGGTFPLDPAWKGGWWGRCATGKTSIAAVIEFT